MRLPATLVKLAISQIGVTEENNSNCGKIVNEFKAATWLPADKAWPWCAGLICWLVREAMKATGVKETATFKRPRTAGAWDFINWSREQDSTTSTRVNPGDDIKPGDILVFKFSHIGLAVDTPSSGRVDTIEGNTNKDGSREGDGVYRKSRSLGEIRARIRFTV